MRDVRDVSDVRDVRDVREINRELKLQRLGVCSLNFKFKKSIFKKLFSGVIYIFIVIRC